MKIVITGPCGSGKSTLAKLLREKINAQVCEVDIFLGKVF